MIAEDLGKHVLLLGLNHRFLPVRPRELLYQLNFGSNVRNSAILAIEVDNGTTKGAPSVLSCGDDEDPGFGNCVGPANENPNFVKVVTKEPGAVGTSPLPFYVAVLL